MTKQEIVTILTMEGLRASITDRSAQVFVADATGERAVPGFFSFRIVCSSDDVRDRARRILSQYYDISINGDVWRLNDRRRDIIFKVRTTPTPPGPTSSPMYLKASEANSTVSAGLWGENEDFNIQYSTDGTTWQEWQKTAGDNGYVYDTITLGAIGDTVYFRGDNTAVTDDSTYAFCFLLTEGSVAAGGNVMSILDSTMQQTEVPAYGFAYMYAGCTSLTTAAEMPSVTTIGEFGCGYMYQGCTSLTTAADMPSLTTIGDSGCSGMYAGCTSLTTAAEMPSLTTIGNDGCNYMYGGCTSLTTAADMPSVTTIGDRGCINMYRGCTSLTTAAEMPSLTTIGNDGCSDMYNGCTFDMSNDGTTLNFAFPTPPITTTGDNPQTYATAYDVADWMGNTNGFTTP